MDTIAVTETLFNAFAEGEILTDDNTYKKMVETLNDSTVLLKTGKLGEDELCILQYVAMQAGFYAGINAMRSLFTV